MNIVKDHAQRSQAIDPLNSFIVSAPAGSGKTGLITQRILRLLSTVNNPEEILSITFTRKASAEMAERVTSALQHANNYPRPTTPYEAKTWDLARLALEQNRIKRWNLLEMPGRLKIQTIDSFCRYIARQFSLETSIGELPEPTEHPELHYQAASRSLLSQLETDNPITRHIEVLLTHTGNDLSRCERLLSELLSKRDQWLPLIFNVADNKGYFDRVLEDITQENLLQLEATLMPIAGELIALIDYAASQVLADNNERLHGLLGICEFPDTCLQSILIWKDILNMLVTKDGTIRRRVDKNSGFPTNNPEQKARMLALLDWCRTQADFETLAETILNLPNESINSTQQSVLDALSYILPRLAAQLDIQFASQDQCDYPAITLSALEALSTQQQDLGITDITLRLDYQLRHILVDEFQDTSGSQLELLTKLVAGWEPDDGRTLFLVGDAMQSLYGFRNANVGLFINSQKNPIGPVHCIPLSLTTNFRSDPKVVNWVNEVFAEAFPQHADVSRGAVPYSQSIGFNKTCQQSGVTFRGFTGEFAQIAEADHIAKTCIQLTPNNASIAILVRSRNHLIHIVPALQKAGLQWEAHGITPLATRMPVLDMMSLTKAILSPADRIAWLSILRAPFCGFSLSDLLLVVNSSNTHPDTGDAIFSQMQRVLESSANSQLSNYARSSLARVTPILTRALKMRGRMDIRRLVESTWQALGGPSTLFNTSDLTDIRTYLDLLETHQKAGLVNHWSSFERAVEKLYAHPSSGLNHSSESANIIQIMTIHKSKGLEFDHVFLPALDRQSASDSKPLLRWQKRVNDDNQSSLIMAPLGAHDEEDDSVYAHLKYEANCRSRFEDTRVLYVAATRAVKNLYLYGHLKLGKANDFITPGKSSLLNRIWTSINSSIKRGDYLVEATETYSSLQSIALPKRLVHITRLVSDFVAPAEVQSAIISGNVKKTTEDSGIAKNEVSFRARHLGTIVHRTLKQIAIDGVDHWPFEKIEQLPKAWRAQINELGIIPQQSELDQLLFAVTTMINDPKGKWILHSHSGGDCELSLSFFHAETQTVGTSVIDRTFVENGTRWIVDYKFTSQNDTESQDQFVSKQIAHYQGQLQHYARLFHAMAPEPVRCALYFPMMALFTEVMVD
ncbi:MAG TPA: DNA helicase UvrD [Porticoccaceae bacterium]|nr:DNA helicase UvrD [Porticoccaceae bacterium]